MANWPSYTFELIGNSKDRIVLKEIVDILVDQTPEEYVEWSNNRSWLRVTICGETAWGLRKVDKIAEKIEDNKLSARFNHSDSYNSTYITMWDRGRVVYDKDMCSMNLFDVEEELTDEEKEFLDVWNDPKEWNKIIQNHISNMKQEYEEESANALKEILEKIRNGEEVPGLEKFEAPEKPKDDNVNTDDPKDMSFIEFIKYQQKLSGNEPKPGELPF